MTNATENTLENHVQTIAVTSRPGPAVLDREAYAHLTETLRHSADNADVRVVVLRGFNGCFCKGGDLSEFLDKTKHGLLISTVTDLFRTLAEFPKPLIASVDGDAIGVGCTLLFHCDMVFASERSTFRVPFVDFGLIPDAATSMLAPQRMGYANAFRFFCLGDTLDASAALSCSIISDLVHSNDIAGRVAATARQLARKPQHSLLQTRGLLRGDRSGLKGRIDHEIALFRCALQDEGTMRRLSRIARLAA
ncbi:MAG: enoyl-CoA hydratase-related protein [Rhizobiaceae bacterium]